MGCDFLLQGIFPTEELNPCLLHWQEDSLLLSPLESPYCIAQGTILSILKQPIREKNLKKTDTYVFINESLCYIPKTNTTLEVNYPSVSKIIIKEII